MPYLSADDKAFFRENGYLIKHDVLSQAQIQAAQRFADGWLGFVKMLAGRVNAARSGDRDKRFEVVDVHDSLYESSL